MYKNGQNSVIIITMYMIEVILVVINISNLYNNPYFYPQKKIIQKRFVHYCYYESFLLNFLRWILNDQCCAKKQGVYQK